jgi:microcystin-dependent protein
MYNQHIFELGGGIMTALDELKKEVTALQTELKALSKQVVVVGTIVPYGGESEPGDGWLLCNGRALERDKYQELYQVISANFGAPDNDHFNLPDLRGRFLRGVDKGAQRDPDASARGPSAKNGNTGDRVGSTQQDALQGHYHNTTAINNASSKSTAMRGASWRMTDRNPADVREVTSDPDFGDVKVSEETRPQNVYVSWIIYTGVQT